MSERFLEGFVVSPPALAKLIGTPKLAPKAIRAKLARRPVLKDIDMTLGEGDARDGKLVVDAALDVLAHGRPRPRDSAYAMTRVAALIVHAYGKPLGTIEVPYVEGDGFGLWNPVFRALEMPALAKGWGVPSFAFPYAKRTPKTTVGWPIAMLAPASWKHELARAWTKPLLALPAKPFTDRTYGTEPARIAMVKTELVAAIAKLAAWTRVPRTHEALVLILDGDQ